MLMPEKSLENFGVKDTDTTGQHTTFLSKLLRSTGSFYLLLAQNDHYLHSHFDRHFSLRYYQNSGERQPDELVHPLSMIFV